MSDMLHSSGKSELRDQERPAPRANHGTASERCREEENVPEEYEWRQTLNKWCSARYWMLEGDENTAPPREASHGVISG